MELRRLTRSILGTTMQSSAFTRRLVTLMASSSVRNEVLERTEYGRRKRRRKRKKERENLTKKIGNSVRFPVLLFFLLLKPTCRDASETMTLTHSIQISLHFWICWPPFDRPVSSYAVRISSRRVSDHKRMRAIQLTVCALHKAGKRRQQHTSYVVHLAADLCE